MFNVYALLADILIVLHLFFILFVIFGAVLVLRWYWLVWLHVPAVIWGVLIEYSGWLCPLTPLEWYLRERAGQQGYDSGFIEHYFVPLVYPAGLERLDQFLLGTIVLVFNVIIYSLVVRKRSGEEQ